MSQLLPVTLICNCICHNLYLYLCWNLYLHFCISHSPQINYIDFDLLLYLVHFILVFVSKVVFASLWLWVYCICIEIRICSCSFVFHTLRKLLRFVTSALYSMHQAQCPFTQPKICVNLYTLVSSSKCRASIQCTSAQCPFHKSAKPNNLKVTVHQTVCIFSKKSSIAFRNTLCILDTCQRWISLVLYFYSA